MAGLYTDDQSGKDLNRPDVRRLIADWKSGLWDVVVVYKLDRLTRSSRDLEYLLQVTEETGRGFKSVTESFLDSTTPLGRMMIRLIIAFAGYERDLILERTYGGLERRIREGHQHGPIPFGYRPGPNGGPMVVEPNEAALVRKAFDLYSKGHGLAELRRLLPGVPRMQSLLRRPTYIGYLKFGQLKVKGHHEPIVSEALFDQVQRVRLERCSCLGEARATFLLSGILRCGTCGAPYGGTLSAYRNRYYICHRRRAKAENCRNPRLRLEDTDQLVLRAIAEALSPERLEETVRNHVKALTETNGAARKELDRLKDQERGLVGRRQRWYAAYEEGNITSAQLRDRLSELDQRLMQNQEEQSRLRVKLEAGDPEPVIKRAVEAARRLEESVGELPVKEARNLLKQVIKTAVVRPDGQIDLELFRF